MRVESLKKVAVKSIYFKIVTLLSEAEKASRKTLQPGKKSKKRNLHQPESESGSWTVIENQSVKKNLNFIKNQSVAEFQKKLNEHLVGNYRNVREELRVEYNKQPAEERPDLCKFLDCILDDSFIGLEFSQQNLPSTLFNKEGNFYPLQIVETVSKCCPSLQEISFTISTHELPRSAEALWAKFSFLS
jgi:hypothetical protein